MALAGDEPERVMADLSENRQDNFLRINTYNFLGVGITENASVYFKADEDAAQKLFIDLGLKVAWEPQMIKAHRVSKSDTQKISYDSPTEINGFHYIETTRVLDPRKPLIHAVRRAVPLNQGSPFSTVGDMFEQYVDNTARVLPGEVTYNNQFVFQGYPWTNSEAYKGFRSVALPLLQQIVDKKIPVIFHGKGFYGFCLVNP